MKGGKGKGKGFPPSPPPLFLKKSFQPFESLICERSPVGRRTVSSVLGAGRRWMSCDFTSCSDGQEAGWRCFSGCPAADPLQEASEAAAPVAQGRDILCHWTPESLHYVPLDYWVMANMCRCWQGGRSRRRQRFFLVEEYGRLFRHHVIILCMMFRVTSVFKKGPA